MSWHPDADRPAEMSKHPGADYYGGVTADCLACGQWAGTCGSEPQFYENLWPPPVIRAHVFDGALVAPAGMKPSRAAVEMCPVRSPF